MRLAEALMQIVSIMLSLHLRSRARAAERRLSSPLCQTAVNHTRMLLATGGGGITLADKVAAGFLAQMLTN